MFNRNNNYLKQQEFKQDIEKYGFKILSRLLSKNNLYEFGRGLSSFIELGGDINCQNDEGRTILDIHDFLNRSSPNYNDIRNLIVDNNGVNSNTAQQQSSYLIIPGFDINNLSEIALSPVRRFSFEDSNLMTVSEFLSSPVIQNITEDGGVDVCFILEQNKPGIGKLFDCGNFVCTIFLIKNDWVMTARHSVNHSKPENLTVIFGDEDFDEDIAIPVSGVIEGGRRIELDYVVLKLSYPVENIKPLILSTENSSTSLLFTGYNQENILQFSANSNFYSGNFDQLKIIGFQGTGPCFSGSPYFDLDGSVCGIHSSASTDKKTGIYIKTIIETNPTGPLACLIRKENVSNKPLLTGKFFGEFKSPTAIFDFDERGHFKMSVDIAESYLISINNRNVCTNSPSHFY